jgi:predicted DNA-binding transcriptional regulator AlpA
MTEGITRIIRERDVDAYCGLRRTQRAVLIRRGQFPAPIPLSDHGRARGYLESDLITWQQQRIARRDATPSGTLLQRRFD